MNFDDYLQFLTESDMSILTVNDYRSTYDRFFRTYEKITDEHIRSFLASANAASTKRKYRVQLKSLCDFENIKIDWKRIPQPKQRNEAPLTVTEQHERQITKYMERRDHKSAKMFSFLLETGLRISEMVNLGPEHYKKIENAGGKLYHVLQISTDMQTHSLDGRYVPLSITARHIIEEFGLPFNLDRRRFNDLLIQARTSLKLPDYKIHNLRKTFMSRALARGIDVVTIANVMGHKQLSTMLAYADREAHTVCEAFNEAA